MIGGYTTKLLFSIYNYSIKKVGSPLFIIWDTFTTVSSECTSEVPVKPLEDGRFSSNSKIRKPLLLTITAVKSTPFFMYKDIEKLNNSVRTNDLFVISTRYGNYKNYTLQDFNYTLDSKTGTSLHASMTFSEVIIVQAEYTSLPIRKVRNKKNASTVDGGKKKLKATSESSLAYKALTGEKII